MRDLHLCVCPRLPPHAPSLPRPASPVATPFRARAVSPPRFFPDSRLNLDLNTDRALRAARFDRHFVRDLTWSREQLEELAKRRFSAAQIRVADHGGDHAPGLGSGSGSGLRSGALHGGSGDHRSGEDGGGGGGDRVVAFEDLFRMVKVEDFSSYLAKVSTPRELLIMMTEIMARIENRPGGCLTAQDMEIAVGKAREQTV